MVGASAMAVGSSAHVGFATFSSFTVFGGDIPALPILAAIPTRRWQPGLGGFAHHRRGISCRGGPAVRPATLPLPLLALAKVAVASPAAAVIMAVPGYAAGGTGELRCRRRRSGDVRSGGLLWFAAIGAHWGRHGRRSGPPAESPGGQAGSRTGSDSHTAPIVLGEGVTVEVPVESEDDGGAVDETRRRESRIHRPATADGPQRVRPSGARRRRTRTTSGPWSSTTIDSGPAER